MQRQKMIAILAKGLWALMSLSLVLFAVQGARLGAVPAWAVALSASA